MSLEPYALAHIAQLSTLHSLGMNTLAPGNQPLASPEARPFAVLRQISLEDFSTFFGEFSTASDSHDLCAALAAAILPLSFMILWLECDLDGDPDSLSFMPGPTKVTGVHWRTSTVTGNQWDMIDTMDKITRISDVHYTATRIQWIYHCVQWIAPGSNGAHGDFQWISRQIQCIHTNYHSVVHFLTG
ncbi:hypothetical protein C8J57DRAFT_1241844 [Mycena rebaudengoi]|nr:hypothetical protein C8J57DRAFT_1241844 [Mycena rebaudengoi]